MNAHSIHSDQHRAAHRQAGEPACSGIGAPSYADQFQFTPEHSQSLTGSGRSLRGGCVPRGRQTLARGRGLARRFCRAIHPPSLRVGWCFNTAAEFLEFHALTRGGVQPLHAVAVMSPVLPGVDQGPRIQASLFEPVADASHVSVPSDVRGLNDEDHDKSEGRIIGKVFQYGA